MSKFDKESSHIFVYGTFSARDGDHKDVIFAEAHLKAKKGNEEERVNQVLKLVDFKRQADQFYDGKYSVIITGDFNDVPESDSIHEVMEQEFIDCYTMKDLNYSNDENNTYKNEIREA